MTHLESKNLLLTATLRKPKKYTHIKGEIQQNHKFTIYLYTDSMIHKTNIHRFIASSEPFHRSICEQFASYEPYLFGSKAHNTKILQIINPDALITYKNQENKDVKRN